jgi:hypothetical protein
MASALAALLDSSQIKCVERFCGWPGERSMKKVGMPASDESPVIGGWARLRDVHMKAPTVTAFSLCALSGENKGLLLSMGLEDGQIRVLEFHGEVCLCRALILQAVTWSYRNINDAYLFHAGSEACVKACSCSCADG